MLIEKLQEEKQRQEDNHRLVTSWIKKEKDSWFSSSESFIISAELDSYIIRFEGCMIYVCG